MTQDEIIRMAREAGFFINRDGAIESPLKEGCEINEYIERLIAMAANHERESCAVIAENVSTSDAYLIAHLIRNK